MLSGGLAREFLERVGRVYGEPVSWLIEPDVAREILSDWLRRLAGADPIQFRFDHTTDPRLIG